MLLFLSGVFSKFKVLADFRLLVQLTHKVLVIKLMREPYEFIHHLQDVRSGLDSFRILNLFIYVFIAWYIRNLSGWVFMFFNDFYSNFLTPGNAAGIYCRHQVGYVLVKIQVIIWVNVTRKLLHQISKFLIFILV